MSTLADDVGQPVVNMHEAKTQLSALIAHAEAVEDVVIARAGQPAVRPIPVREEGPTWVQRIDGALAGRIWMSEDFDAPMPELEHGVYHRPLEP